MECCMYFETSAKNADVEKYSFILQKHSHKFCLGHQYHPLEQSLLWAKVEEIFSVWKYCTDKFNIKMLQIKNKPTLLIPKVDSFKICT